MKNNLTKCIEWNCNVMIETKRPCKNYGVLLSMSDDGSLNLLCLNCAKNQGYICWFRFRKSKSGSRKIGKLGRSSSNSAPFFYFFWEILFRGFPPLNKGQLFLRNFWCFFECDGWSLDQKKHSKIYQVLWPLILKTD